MAEKLSWFKIIYGVADSVMLLMPGLMEKQARENFSMRLFLTPCSIQQHLRMQCRKMII